MDALETQAPQERAGQDRRRHRLPSLRAQLLNPRRRTVRRTADRRSIVVLDYYKTSMLLPAVLVLVFSATDALLTIFLLNHGATEINPLMAYLLEKGPVVFLAVKYLLTAIFVMIMVLLNYMFIPFLKMFMSDLLKISAGVFAAVIGWQLFIIFRYLH